MTGKVGILKADVYTFARAVNYVFGVIKHPRGASLWTLGIDKSYRFSQGPYFLFHLFYLSYKEENRIKLRNVEGSLEISHVISDFSIRG